jgi:nucleoside 2-deoxyribosyltransferase
MNIYFAGSIRGGRANQEDYFHIIEMLKDFGSVLTEHIGSKELSSKGEDLSSGEIFQRDSAWVNRADVLVAEVTTPSLGVGFEIGSVAGNTPIICLFREEEGKRLSAMIDGNPAITVRKYKTIKEIPKILLAFFDQFPTS